MSKKRKHTEGKFVRGFGRYAMALRLIKARNWDELTQLFSSSGNFDHYARYLLNELRLLNLCVVIPYELCTLLEKLHQVGKLKNLSKLESAILQRCARIGPRQTRSRRRLSRKYDKDFSSIWFTPPILLDEADYGLRGLRSLVESYSQLNFLQLGLVAADFEMVEEARNQVCHNPCSSRRMPNREMARAVKAGMRIHKALDMLKEHFTEDETQRLMHNSSRYSCALCRICYAPHGSRKTGD